MGKKATFLLAHLMLILFTYLIALLTLGAWSASIILPQKSWFITFISLGITPLLLTNLLLLIWWGVKRRFLVLVPLAAILLNYNYISAIYQFDFRSSDTIPAVDLKIASYNTHGYAHKDFLKTMGQVGDFFAQEGVDIVCLQELKLVNQIPIDSLHARFTAFPYRADYADIQGGELAVFSRYPITCAALIPFSQTDNSAMWADVTVKGYDIRIFNNHFQTTNINQSRLEISEFKKKGITDPQGKEAFDVIMHRLYINYCKRVEQVSKVRNVMDTTTRLQIVCGDFNDIPISYSYKHIRGNLVDGFKSSGKGYMYTYKPLLKLLRLDYIFHSPELDGVQYESPTVSWSDHNPVLLSLSLGNGEKEL